MTDTVDGISTEPTLPGLELPEYHGRKPTGMKSSITGSSNRITSVHEIGETVIAVVELKTKGAGHAENETDGLFYSETYKVKDLFEVRGAGGKRLLSVMRNQYRSAEEANGSKRPIDGMTEPDHFGLEGVTDASGVALTPAELAEARRDPVRAIVDERLAPVVIVFSDGSRQLWPDEFAQDTPRPAAGARYELEPGDWHYLHVAKVLSAETGETLEEWTDEQESGRLELLEEIAKEAEADGRDVLDAMHAAGYPRPEGPGAEIDRKLAETAAAKDEVRREELEIEAAERGLEGRDREDWIEKQLDAAGDADLGELIELVLPRPEDFAFVDRDLPAIKADLSTVEDRAHVLRLIKAEEGGRGRKLKIRKGALELLEARLRELPEPPLVEEDYELEPFDPGDGDVILED